MLDDDTSWHIRHLIQQELQGVAREIRAKREGWGGHIKMAMDDVADAIEEHVSRMVGRLQREADEAKNAEDDRRESTLAPLPVIR